MRIVERPKPFRQDFKRENRGEYRRLLVMGGEFERIVLALANDELLPLSYRTTRFITTGRDRVSATSGRTSS